MHVNLHYYLDKKMVQPTVHKYNVKSTATRSEHLLYHFLSHQFVMLPFYHHHWLQPPKSRINLVYQQA